MKYVRHLSRGGVWGGISVARRWRSSSLVPQGTIASIFNDATTLGRRYVFDIRRTCREVHDGARRAAHAAGRDARPRRRSSSGNEHMVSKDQRPYPFIGVAAWERIYWHCLLSLYAADHLLSLREGKGIRDHYRNLFGNSRKPLNILEKILHTY